MSPSSGTIKNLLQQRVTSPWGISLGLNHVTLPTLCVEMCFINNLNGGSALKLLTGRGDARRIIFSVILLMAYLSVT